MQTAVETKHNDNSHLLANAEISAIDAARQLQIDLNRLYVLLRLGRIVGRKVDGEWRVCRQSVVERLNRR